MRTLLTLFLPVLWSIGVLNNAAPADKYFGKLKMSALRIRYEIAQLKTDYEYHRRTPDDVLHLLSFADDAYYQWAAAYPKDSWLASTGYNLAKLYEELPGYVARDSAIRTLQFVRTHFKNTRYSKASVAELQRGIPVRPEPAWAARATASPSSSPAPSSSPSSLPSAVPSPTAI